MNEHPNLLLFEGTERTTHHLVMVVGQEPNNTGRMVHGIGHYPERAITTGTRENVPFWDRGFGVVARAAGLSGPAELKRLVRERGSSPVAFSDVSPRPLPSGTASKGDLYAGIPDEEFEEHAGAVFSHAIVRDRVDLVILAGTRLNGLDHGSRIFEQACIEAGKRFVRIASLSARTTPRRVWDEPLKPWRSTIAACVADLPPRQPEPAFPVAA